MKVVVAQGMRGSVPRDCGGAFGVMVLPVTVAGRES